MNLIPGLAERSHLIHSAVHYRAMKKNSIPCSAVTRTDFTLRKFKNCLTKVRMPKLLRILWTLVAPHSMKSLTRAWTTSRIYVAQTLMKVTRRITLQALPWPVKASSNIKFKLAMKLATSQAISLCRARALTVSCRVCQRHLITFSCSMDLVMAMDSSTRISHSCPLPLNLHQSKLWWQESSSPKLRKPIAFNWQKMRLISFLKLKCWPSIKLDAEWSRKLSKNK